MGLNEEGNPGGAVSLNESVNLGGAVGLNERRNPEGAVGLNERGNPGGNDILTETANPGGGVIVAGKKNPRGAVGRDGRRNPGGSTMSDEEKMDKLFQQLALEQNWRKCPTCGNQVSTYSFFFSKRWLCANRGGRYRHCGRQCEIGMVVSRKRSPFV